MTRWTPFLMSLSAQTQGCGEPAPAVVFDDVSAPSPWTLPAHASPFTERREAPAVDLSTEEREALERLGYGN